MSDTDAAPDGTESDEATETPEAPDLSVNQDAEAWQSLDADEQDAVLDEGLDRLTGKSGEGHWRHLSLRAQQKTVQAIERNRNRDIDEADLSPAEQAMREALSGTWTADLFDDDDDRPTIPFECRELEELEQDIVEDGFRMLVAIQEEAESVEDADDLSIEEIEHESEFFDSIEAFENWFFAFLGDVTQDEEFDEERFKSGAGLIAGTRTELMGELFLRYQDQETQANAEKFRNEPGR